MSTFDINSHYKAITKHLLAKNDATADVVDHGTFLGDASESIFSGFLGAILPRGYRVERGQLVLPNGIYSPEPDLIVFNDTMGAVVGRTEAGVYLIHAEAARVLIQVKRSLAADQIDRLQSHAARLHDAFADGHKQLAWCQWGFSFRSPDRSSDSILTKLNETHNKTRSVGLLCVLDAKVSAEDRNAAIEKCIKRDASTSHESVDRQAFRTLVESATEPKGCLFGRRPEANFYKDETQGDIPPLLTFVAALCRALDDTYEKSIAYIGKFAGNGKSAPAS